MLPHRRLEKVALPDGWTWSGDWVTDYGRGDDEGWEYAVNFDRAWHKAYGTGPPWFALACVYTSKDLSGNKPFVYLWAYSPPCTHSPLA
jgi:hypothetical protein